MINSPLPPTRLDLIRSAVKLNPGDREGAEADRATLLAEVERLNALLPDELLAALTELVECRELKDRLDGYEASGTDELAEMAADYDARKPVAWDVARALITKLRPPPPPPEPPIEYCAKEFCCLPKGHEGDCCDIPF